MALKQRAEQSSHTESLGWEEEDEGMNGGEGDDYPFQLKENSSVQKFPICCFN